MVIKNINRLWGQFRWRWFSR